MSKKNSWTRREFLHSASASAARSPSYLRVRAPTPFTGRYITHVSVVRVNQIEVTRTHSIGQDEVPDNAIEHIRARRDAFTAAVPMAA